VPGGRVASGCQPPGGRAGRVSIRVIVADDQVLARAGFRVIIDSTPDLAVVGEAANGAEAVVTL